MPVSAGLQEVIKKKPPCFHEGFPASIPPELVRTSTYPKEKMDIDLTEGRRGREVDL